MGSERFDWERALMASDLPSGRKLVLLVLATYVNRHGIAFPTQTQLADACGMKERAIRGHLSAAIEEGWIERLRVGRSGVASEYQLSTGTVPTGTDVPPPTGTPEPVDESQPANSDTQPASDDTSTGTPVPTNMYQHVDTTPAPNSTPLNVHLTAIKFGKGLAGIAEDETALRRQFDANRSLSTFPDVYAVVLDHWLRATGQRTEPDMEEMA